MVLLLWGAPAILKLAINTVAGLSFARLSGGLIEASWKRQFVYGLIFVLIITELLNVLDLPLPLFRLYTVLAALAALLVCIRWTGESIRQKGSGLCTWSLRSGTVLFAAIIIAELWGKAALARDLFLSLIDSIATVLVFMLFLYMIHGVIEWVFRSSPLRRTTVVYKDPDVIIADQVTNRTLSNRCVRLTIPVGGAYGSDVPLVMELLMACANDNPMISRVDIILERKERMPVLNLLSKLTQCVG
jgi:small-conductance mechanosensitive channel